ncbi:hypothetical protein [Streptomyces griseoruber]|uniref:Uncharacterized protein n=1 Tax=Streptomyces griseoruber TaxID=1943 RepID=A0A101SUC8_9ACTN|nr:hypothetical protein [Streptomyces griseoruber]KUN80196.1 hypothetical protein AQJ64_25880 [Streptomyces griseoruber]
MDENEARDIAVDFLLASASDAAEWKMQGPSRQVLVHSTGRRECLVFGFWPPSGSSEDPLRIGVDPETREAFVV